jgi:hypothetical protein
MGAAGVGRHIGRSRLAGLGWSDVGQVAAFGAVGVAGVVVNREILRKLEDQRGRVALGLLADAGYDPWQAPEAWRRLDPKQLPKDMSRLKYPGRARYQLEILGMQYKRAAASTAAAARGGNAAAKPD